MLKNSLVLNFLYPYFYRLRRPLLISVSLACAGEIFSRIAFFFGSRLIGLISSDPADRSSVWGLAVTYILAFSFLMAIRGIVVNASIRVDADFLPSMQTKVYRDLFTIAHKHSPEYFEMEMSGNISAKIENIVGMVERFYYAGIWVVLNPIMVLIISIVSIMLINVELSLILVFLTALYVYLMYKSSRLIMPYTKATTDLSSRANGELIDSLINADIVKSFGKRFSENRNYFKKLRKVASAGKKEIQMSGWIYILQSTFRTIIQVTFCIIPLYFWYKDKLSLENYVFIQSVVLALIYVFNSMIDMFLRLFSRYSIIQDGLELVLRPSAIVPDKNAKDLEVSQGRIEFADMTFAYKDLPPIFKNFTLSIKPKEKVGLVGYSGSGKTTLIKLINRYYDVTSGSVKIDGQDVRSVSERSLRKNISFIPQEPNLFNRSIMENIRYGNLLASDEEVFEAARKAHCHEFIQELPNGYDSRVGERGVMLSGGERQRIAIARAILKNAPILILDEATSALDSESEKYIKESLTALMDGKTVIAIAHRLSTLNKMDKIVVLDNGEIKEEGRHNSLLRRKGIYHKFYNMQML